MDYFHLNASPEQAAGLSNLGLAHLGDAVFELMVRSWLCLHGKATARGLHRAAIGYVSAPAQARAAAALMPMLTEQEREVYRRGRNTSSAHVPKAASREEYQAATALETLFGHLYLKGETERLNELFGFVMGE